MYVANDREASHNKAKHRNGYAARCLRRYKGRTVELPSFQYHPDPIATGAIKASDEVCECCDKPRGYIYTSTIYAEEEIEFICPWCISDGSAANKYDGLFSDNYPLQESGVSQEAISEVCERTPGYNSWQQEEWQSLLNCIQK